ncbi:MAG: ribbon-helix-helix domain-containing protein [Pseudanabaenales cyanobacterium]|nr:ribbon-helix-helix domain-containing protein [Pseudanabaenales cyanobacterium]
MANKTVSFRIPDEIIQALETQVKTTGRSKTSLIVEALAQALGLPQASPEVITITSLQHQLQVLEQKVTALSSQLAEFRLKTYSRIPSRQNSKLLDQAVISFQALSPTDDNLRGDLLFFSADENLTATAEEL